jgi:hypothetical protein
MDWVSSELKDTNMFASTFIIVKVDLSFDQVNEISSEYICSLQQFNNTG